MGTNECCYSNCSVIIPRLIYSAGDLAAAVVLTAFIVAGISVAVHLSLFYLIYKKKFLPKLQTEGQRSSPPATAESAPVIGDGSETRRRDDAKGNEMGAVALPMVRVNQNLAYGKINYKK